MFASAGFLIFAAFMVAGISFILSLTALLVVNSILSRIKILADGDGFEEWQLRRVLFRVMLPAAKNGLLASGA